MCFNKAIQLSCTLTETIALQVVTVSCIFPVSHVSCNTLLLVTIVQLVLDQLDAQECIRMHVVIALHCINSTAVAMQTKGY